MKKNKNVSVFPTGSQISKYYIKHVTGIVFLVILLLIVLKVTDVNIDDIFAPKDGVFTHISFGYFVLLCTALYLAFKGRKALLELLAIAPVISILVFLPLTLLALYFLSKLIGVLPIGLFSVVGFIVFSPIIFREKERNKLESMIRSKAEERQLKATQREEDRIIDKRISKYTDEEFINAIHAMPDFSFSKICKAIAQVTPIAIEKNYFEERGIVIHFGETGEITTLKEFLQFTEEAKRLEDMGFIDYWGNETKAYPNMFLLVKRFGKRPELLQEVKDEAIKRGIKL